MNSFTRILLLVLAGLPISTLIFQSSHVTHSDHVYNIVVGILGYIALLIMYTAYSMSVED